mmetsp:Transcript_4441/g.10787  ORF Transcript_4441/g.10787 Transcript_4441/m.10787 type:complete len:247 (+) Transcript_4441:108-848(+)
MPSMMAHAIHACLVSALLGTAGASSSKEVLQALAEGEYDVAVSGEEVNEDGLCLLASPTLRSLQQKSTEADSHDVVTAAVVPHGNSAASCSGVGDGSAGGCPCCGKSMYTLIGQQAFSSVNPAWGRMHISLKKGCFDKVASDVAQHGGHMKMTFANQVSIDATSCYVYYPVKTCTFADGKACPQDKSCFKWGRSTMEDVRHKFWHVSVLRSWAKLPHNPHLESISWKAGTWAAPNRDISVCRRRRR